jgi:hypothetical protein
MTVDVDEIKKTLDHYFKYTGKISIDPQSGLISCTGSVRAKDIAMRNVKRLPVKFGKIRNDFKIGWGELESLEGAPTWVGGEFDCTLNRITSLEGAPQHVGRSFDCSHNRLTSLEHCPKFVGLDFHCQSNQLSSLEHCPEAVSDLFCMENPLISLKGAPRKVDGELRCWGIDFQSLDGAPEEINGPFWMDTPDPNLPLLKLLTIRGLAEVTLGEASNDLQDIINRYLGRGINGVMPCAAELIKAGFRGNAKL